MSSWPPGTRLILRKERPTPELNYGLPTRTGLRVTAFITDTGHGLVCGQLGGLSSNDFDSVLVGPPPSSGKLGAQSFNLDTQPLRGRVSWFGWRRGGQLRREPAVHFVRGSERVSAGVTTAVAARYRGGPGR